MERTLPPHTRRRLEIQGFDVAEEQRLAEVLPWQRLAFLLCAVLVGIGTATASPIVLLASTPIAAIAAIAPVHPFDLIYNHGIRHVRGTGPLPKRAAPSRFACGIGALFMLVTAWLFAAGHLALGYALGGSLTAVALLVGTTDVCIPSMVYQRLFVRRARRPPSAEEGASARGG